MRLRKNQEHFVVILEFRHGITRSVNVKASSKQVAERRARKRYPEAVRIKRG